jgi:hypothetical protein
VVHARAGRDALLEKEPEEGEEAVNDVRKSLGFLEKLDQRGGRGVDG